MSRALEDLPDPLEPTPSVPAASTDDLLAKMADEAIDRLMASVDRGTAELPKDLPFTPSADAAAISETPPVVASPVSTPADADPFVFDEAALANAIDNVLPFTEEEVAPPVAVPSPEPVVTTAVEPSPIAPVEPAPAPPADIKALLRDEAEPAAEPSILLLPLRLLNAPFAWVGDRGRTFAGLLAIVTLVPAACAIVYVLFLRK